MTKPRGKNQRRYKLLRIVNPADPGDLHNAIPVAYFSRRNPKGTFGAQPRLRVICPPRPGATPSQVAAYGRSQQSEVSWEEFWMWCVTLRLELRETTLRTFRVGYTPEAKALMRKAKRDNRMARYA